MSDKWKRRHSSVKGTMTASSNAYAWVLLVLMAVILAISNTCCGQPSCQDAKLVTCRCYASYSSPVYDATNAAVVCTGPGAAAAGTTMQEVLTSLVSNGYATALYTLKLIGYGTTTSIQARAFDSFSQVRELVISTMPVTTIHPTAFLRLTKLVSISLLNLRSGQMGLGFLDFATLFPNTTTLEIIDLSRSRVSGIVRGSFANKIVKTLWLHSADIRSLTEDLLVHVTNISLAGTSWTCNACICPLVTKALRITWTDSDMSTCGVTSPTHTQGRRLDSMTSCGCSGNTTTAATCTESGDYTCETRTAVVQLNCSIPHRSAYSVCLPTTSAPAVTTGRPGAPTVDEDEPRWQKDARAFLTSTAGIITTCAAAIFIITVCFFIVCCYRTEQKKARQAESAQRLLRELRSSSFRKSQSGGSQDDFAFPDFGGTPDSLSLENPSPGSVMQAVSSGLNGDVGSQKKLPHPDKKTPAASPQPTPNTSPQRSISTSRAGSMISRTSLRNQPIFEEEEDGDPMEC